MLSTKKHTLFIIKYNCIIINRIACFLFMSIDVLRQRELNHFSDHFSSDKIINNLVELEMVGAPPSALYRHVIVPSTPEQNRLLEKKIQKLTGFWGLGIARIQQTLLSTWFLLGMVSVLVLGGGLFGMTVAGGILLALMILFALMATFHELSELREEGLKLEAEGGDPFKKIPLWKGVCIFFKHFGRPGIQIQSQLDKVKKIMESPEGISFALSKGDKKILERYDKLDHQFYKEDAQIIINRLHVGESIYKERILEIQEQLNLVNRFWRDRFSPNMQSALLNVWMVTQILSTALGGPMILGAAVFVDVLLYVISSIALSLYDLKTKKMGVMEIGTMFLYNFFCPSAYLTQQTIKKHELEKELELLIAYEEVLFPKEETHLSHTRKSVEKKREALIAHLEAGLSIHRNSEAG